MSRWHDAYSPGDRVEVMERGSDRWTGAVVESIGAVGHRGGIAMLVRLDATGYIARAEKTHTRKASLGVAVCSCGAGTPEEDLCSGCARYVASLSAGRPEL